MSKTVRWALLVAVTIFAALLFSTLFLDIAGRPTLGDMRPPAETYIRKTYTDIQIIDVSPETVAETEAETETEPETEAETEPETTAPDASPVGIFSDYEVELIGRTIWGEAGGIRSEAERAAVAWCILNRADAWGLAIQEVVLAPYQFHGYRDWGECPREHIDLAADVLSRWVAEKAGASDVGRTLPADYLYFWGDGQRNHFTVEYQGTKYWDWSLTDPYK